MLTNNIPICQTSIPEIIQIKIINNLENHNYNYTIPQQLRKDVLAFSPQFLPKFIQSGYKSVESWYKKVTNIISHFCKC